MRYDLDELLKNALSSQEEPDDWLNQKIIQKVQKKEREEMKKVNQRMRIPAAVLVAAVALMLGSASAYAAWRLLSPSQVAKIAKDQGLAAAFQSKDAAAIHEVQTYGNYRITLLGIVSGKNLSRYLVRDDGGNILEDRTYVVTAIENADGSPRPDTSQEAYGQDPFFVSPLIQGLDPAKHNIVTMDGGYFETVEDGVQYRIAECSNVEKFADRQVYLCVSDGTFYNNEAYQYDADSGQISRNESYQGVNALFCLPLDQSKADPKAAEEYLQNLHSEEDTEQTEEPLEQDFCSRVSQEVAAWKLEDFNEKASLVKEMELLPDEEGNLNYDYTIGADGMSGMVAAETLSDRDSQGLAKSRVVTNGDEENAAYVETYTWADGNWILRVFRITQEDLLK